MKDKLGNILSPGDYFATPYRDDGLSVYKIEKIAVNDKNEWVIHGVSRSGKTKKKFTSYGDYPNDIVKVVYDENVDPSKECDFNK